MDRKQRIMKELEKTRPNDLSIGEVARRTNLLRTTASTYLKILEAKDKIEILRKAVRAIFHKKK